MFSKQGPQGPQKLSSQKSLKSKPNPKNTGMCHKTIRTKSIHNNGTMSERAKRPVSEYVTSI